MEMRIGMSLRLIVGDEMSDSERHEIVVELTKLGAKLDFLIANNKDHEDRIRRLEDTTLTKADIADLIADAVASVIGQVESMQKLTWGDIGRLTAGVIASLAAVAGVFLAVYEMVVA